MALGVTLPIVLPAPPFALYREAVADAIGDARMLDSETGRLVAGITGGSIAGKWAMHWAIVRFGVRARRRWAWRATLAGLVTWFVVDSTSSLLGGAWANVVMINAMPLVVVLPLAWRLRSHCDQPPAPIAPEEAPIARLAIASATIGIVAGLVIAFGTSSPLFDAWWAGLSTAHFAGAPVPHAAHALLRFFAGPIGGSTAGQCAMMVSVARHGVAAREAWAARWSLIALLVWALTDSAWSVSAHGAFDVFLVNIPCVLLLGAPLAWAIARNARRPPGADPSTMEE
jgi:hypothetical protein